MATCDYCDKTILFGGKRDAGFRFCSEECLELGAMLIMGSKLPHEVVIPAVQSVHTGLCPECNGSGPVDVHMSHKIHSFLFYTSWSSTPRVCCRSCGKKSQAGGILYSLLLGWWGIPWGIIITPVQIVRNIKDLIYPPDPSSPSKRLEEIVRVDLAERNRQEKIKLCGGAM